MHIGFIVKVSKLCNMRCVYCCEGNDLANPRHISISEIESFFRSISNFLSNITEPNNHKITFYWHGGEPFAQPIQYWEAILLAQNKAFKRFGERVRILNAIQSNLTLITPKHLPLLKHFRLGFSFDVINDFRVFANGKSTAQKVISKIDWLTKENIPLAGIVVVSAVNTKDANIVAKFYLERHLPFRFINLDEGLEHLPAVHGSRVQFNEYLKFARTLLFNSKIRRALALGLRIDPLSLAIQISNKSFRQSNFEISIQDCAEREHLLEINTDGEVYSTADYPYRNSYGNIFNQSFEELLISSARRERIEQSRQRLNEICRNCKLFRRSCLGTWISHATQHQYKEFFENGGCDLSIIASWLPNHNI